MFIMGLAGKQCLYSNVHFFFLMEINYTSANQRTKSVSYRSLICRWKHRYCGFGGKAVLVFKPTFFRKWKSTICVYLSTIDFIRLWRGTCTVRRLCSPWHSLSWMFIPTRCTYTLCKYENILNRIRSGIIHRTPLFEFQNQSKKATCKRL